MTSHEIKGAILQWLRYDRQFHYVATEVASFHSADVLAAKAGEVVEVEVKISRFDFRADFKKGKHATYTRKMEYPDSELPLGKWERIPNRFYFAVPDALVAEVEPLVAGKPYGLLVIKPILTSDGARIEVTCKKPAKRIHKQPPDAQVLQELAARMSSELCGLYSGHRLVNGFVTRLLETGRAWAKIADKEEIE